MGAKLASSRRTGTQLSSGKGSAHFQDIDKGYEALVQRFYGFGLAPTVDVGVLEGEGAKAKDGAEGVTVLDVAIWNEFGTGEIPERSFIRAWFDENEKKARELVRRLLESVLVGRRNLPDVPELLGQTFVGQIQKRISKGIEPKNADATIDRKGSSTPLVDTGQLRSSITYRVRTGKRL